MNKDKSNDKVLRSTYWPEIVDEKGAREAAKMGASGAGIVAVVTAALSLYSAFVSPVLNLDLWSLIDAFLFTFLAIGIWKMSRVAAVLGLCLYLGEQWNMLTTVGAAANGVMIVIFVLFFVNGIRGTFAYRRIRDTQPATIEGNE